MSNAMAASSANSFERWAAHAGRPRTEILLVEDEEGLRRLLARALREAGYRVHEAGSGTEALAVWENHGRAITLLITDVMLPGTNGCELAEQIHGRRPETPVLFMSGCGGHLVGPGRPFLQKPFPIHRLLSEVRRLMPAADRKPPGTA